MVLLQLFHLSLMVHFMVDYLMFLILLLILYLHLQMLVHQYHKIYLQINHLIHNNPYVYHQISFLYMKVVYVLLLSQLYIHHYLHHNLLHILLLFFMDHCNWTLQNTTYYPYSHSLQLLYLLFLISHLCHMY